MTKANDYRPTIRDLTSRLGDGYVVQLYASHLTIRPKGSRSQKLLVSVEIGQLYLRCLTHFLDTRKGKKGGKRAR